MVRKWRTIRVFISSTFRDTHLERDALTRLIFPELRQWCEDRYLHITEVDLRWGVTQEESAAGKAIEICLNEIDRSDFFLCIVGSRYGWVPDAYEVGSEAKFDWVREQGGLSITELEIMRGALNPEETQAETVSHSMFYFRDEVFLEKLKESPKQQEQFQDGRVENQSGKLVFIEDKDKREKLLRLKQRIREYNSSSDFEGRIKAVVHEDYPSLFHEEGRLSETNEEALRSFCDIVLTDLKNAIDERFPIMRVLDETSFDEAALENTYHQAYMAHRLSTFHNREELVVQVVDFAGAKELQQRGPMIVCGESGVGKSSVLAKACEILELQQARRRSSIQEEAIKSFAALQGNTRIGGGANDAPAAQMQELRQSTFFATRKNLKTQEQSALKPLALIRFFAGASPGSLNIQSVLRVLVQELRRCIKRHKPKKKVQKLWTMIRTSVFLGQSRTLTDRLRETDPSERGRGKYVTRQTKLAAEIPSSYSELVEEFKRLLIEACQDARVVLVLDNLDHLVHDKDHALTLSWLPHELPANLRLIVGIQKETAKPIEPRSPTPEDRGLTIKRPTSPQPERRKTNSTRKLQRPPALKIGSGRRGNRPRSGDISGRKSPLSAFSDPGDDFRTRYKTQMRHIGRSVTAHTKIEQFEQRSFWESFHLHFHFPAKLEIPLLNRDESKELIISQLGQYGKRLSKQQMGILLNKACSGNPTWIVIACEELRVFNLYEKVTERILELAEDVQSLLEQMIKRLEQDHGPRFVRDALSILVCSRDGLFEHEIVGILGVALSTWSQLFYSLKPLLAGSAGRGGELISFSHRDFTIAILKRYFAGARQAITDEDLSLLPIHSPNAIPIHARLAAFFQEIVYDLNGGYNSENGRALSSLAYHFLHGRQFRTLEMTLTNLEYIEALLSAGGGFSWIDDLNATFQVFELTYFAQAQEIQSSSFGFGGSLGLDPSLIKPFQSSPQVGSEGHISLEMIKRIQDYHSFAQRYTPELVSKPSLVLQYAANLPDSNTAAQAAQKLWRQEKSKRSWLRWVNKVQEQGACLLTLTGHTAPVLYVDITEDGKRAVSASEDCTARVWVTATGETEYVLEGHMDAVTCAVISPDNDDVIVTSSRDGTVWVWVKGVWAHKFERHNGVPVLTCCMSSCGKFVCSGDRDGVIKIWDPFAKKEECFHDFHVFPSAVTLCKFSENNEYVFAAGVDRTIRAWRLCDGTQYMCKSGEAMAFSSSCESLEQKMLYCLRTSSMRLKIFDSEHVNSSLAEPSHIKAGSLVAPSRSQRGFGQMLSSKSSFRLTKTCSMVSTSFRKSTRAILEELKEEEEEASMPGRNMQMAEEDMNLPLVRKSDIPRVSLKGDEGQNATRCAIAPSKRIAVGRDDGNIAIYSLDTGEKVCVLHGHISRVNHCVYDASGSTLISASNDHTVKVWNPRRAKLVANTPHKDKVLRASFGRNHGVLSVSQEGCVCVWNAPTGVKTTMKSQAAGKDFIRDAGFSRSGDAYVTISSTVRISSCKPTEEQKIWTIPQLNVSIWDISPCGRIFVCVEAGSSDFHVWSLYTNPPKLVRSVAEAHERRITVCQFSADGSLVFSAGNDGKVNVWDALALSAEKYSASQLATRLDLNGEFLRPMLSLQDEKDLGLASLIHAVHESPSGQTLLAVSDSSDVKVFNIDAAFQGIPTQIISSLHAHDNRVTCAAWSRHDFNFATASVNGTIKIWDSQEMECMLHISAHTSSVVDIRFLPSADQLVSISSDKIIAIWNVKTGEQKNSMSFPSLITQLAISPEGNYIAVGCMNGDLRILELMNESKAFPMVVARRSCSLTLKGKNWQTRAKINCVFCTHAFAINNKMDALLSVENSAETLKDLRFLTRCPSCRHVLRVSPIKLDRKHALHRRIQMMTRRTLRPLVFKEDMTLQKRKADSKDFYDANMSVMAPFRRKKKAPTLSTSSKKAGVEQELDLMARHVHELKLKSQSNQYKTFHDDQSLNVTRNRRRKNRGNNQYSPNEEPFTPVDAFASDLLDDVDLAEAGVVTEFSRELDVKYLAREAETMRHSHTVSSLLKKVDKPSSLMRNASVDFLDPSHTFSVIHGRSNEAPLVHEAGQNGEGAVGVNPKKVDFGLVCERTEVNAHIALTNKGSHLQRFRFEIVSATEEVSLEVTKIPFKLCPGLSSQVTLTLTAGSPGVMIHAHIRISSSSGDLYFVPITGYVASKADAAVVRAQIERTGTSQQTSDASMRAKTPLIPNLIARAETPDSRPRSSAVNVRGLVPARVTPKSRNGSSSSSTPFPAGPSIQFYASDGDDEEEQEQEEQS